MPVRISECDECPWWDYCRPKLKIGAGDVSLLPRIGWREWKIHRDHGVANRSELASLDVRTAQIVADGVDVAGLRTHTAGMLASTPIGDLHTVWPRRSQLTRLEQHGVTTVGRLSNLDLKTASYSGAGLSSLPDQIDTARASLGPDPVYRRRGVATIGVPRADIEVDVDMENVEDGVYLWGALVTDRTETKPAEPGYRAFVTWEPLTPQLEAGNGLCFWRWLDGLRRSAHNDGLSFCAYCYNAAAENSHLRQIGRMADMVGDVEAFIASNDWIDMLRVFNGQLITGGASGLKKIAPLSGFSWSVDDPGGGESMLQYDVAVDGSVAGDQAAAREWLLAYNQDDVEATFALRDWLDHNRDSIPSIELIDATLQTSE